MKNTKELIESDQTTGSIVRTLTEESLFFDFDGNNYPVLETVFKKYGIYEEFKALMKRLGVRGRFHLAGGAAIGRGSGPANRASFLAKMKRRSTLLFRDNLEALDDQEWDDNEIEYYKDGSTYYAVVEGQFTRDSTVFLLRKGPKPSDAFGTIVK